MLLPIHIYFLSLSGLTHIQHITDHMGILQYIPKLFQSIGHRFKRHIKTLEILDTMA